MNTTRDTTTTAAPAPEVQSNCRVAQQLTALQPLIEIGRLAVERYFADARYVGALRKAALEDGDPYKRLEPLNEQVNTTRAELNNAIGAFIETLD